VSNINEIKLKYLGIITSISKKNNQLILSDFPKNIKQLPDNIIIDIGYSPNFTKKYIAQSFIFSNKSIKVKLNQLQSENELKSFIRQAVYVDESTIKANNSDIVLPEDLLDLVVINISNNETIGVISDVQQTDANQVLIIENNDYILPIPNTKNVVKQINLKEKKIYIELIEGLLDLKEEKKKKWH
jgi:ribosomal 30S subunit maturation factor RimM